jgi:hypothetical protein
MGGGISIEGPTAPVVGAGGPPPPGGLDGDGAATRGLGAAEPEGRATGLSEGSIEALGLAPGLDGGALLVACMPVGAGCCLVRSAFRPSRTAIPRAMSTTNPKVRGPDIQFTAGRV